jgi:23S rRNA (uracil-5-)-methyltransferase RumA
MARPPRITPPFETEIDRIDVHGNGRGYTPWGREIDLRTAVPGSRVLVQVAGKKKGRMIGRRLAVLRPAPDAVQPPCPVFGRCGGCRLQEVSPERQRALRDDAVQALFPDVVDRRPPAHGGSAWGYRNRVEMTFGPQRFLSDEEHRAGASPDQPTLGFHAPERHDRLVEAQGCAIIHEDLRRIAEAVATFAFATPGAPPWNTRTHTGFWRHLMLRRGEATGEVLVAIFTTSQHVFSPRIEALANLLRDLSLRESVVVGVEWVHNDGVADVAQGETAAVYGSATLREVLAGVEFTLGRRTFFQTNTAGAAALVATVGEALGVGGTLLDLYGGVGTFALTLRRAYDTVIGVEIVAAAVEDARRTAQANGIDATFTAAAVEDVLDALQTQRAQATGALRILVDPPRAGLHPKVTAWLADVDADVLVYVACHAPSLARDRVVLEAGGWRLVSIQTVDLFPHTGHVETVGRFERVAR